MRQDVLGDDARRFHRMNARLDRQAGENGEHFRGGRLSATSLLNSLIGLLPSLFQGLGVLPQPHSIICAHSERRASRTCFEWVEHGDA